MRKRLIALTAGITAIMMVTSGCSGQTKETAPSTAETQETETSKEETSTQETETTKEETESSAESQPESVQEPGIEVDLAAPIKIWGTITEVTDRAIYVDNQSENSSTGEIVLTIDPETTRILDGALGLPVDMKDITVGGFEAYLGPAMTLSLPPQTVPYAVIVNTPDGEKAAQYVVAAGGVEETEEGKVVSGNDGTAYHLADEVQITPYLTKQLVRLEDIEEGSELLIWLNDEEKADRIVLFN